MSRLWLLDRTRLQVNVFFFFKAETHLVFPKAASVEQLRLVRESIAAERDQRLKGECPVPPAAQRVASAQQSPTAAAGAAAAPAAAPTAAPTPPAGAPSQLAEFSAQQPSSLVNRAFVLTLKLYMSHLKICICFA